MSPADPDRRFVAFALDRLLGAAVVGGVWLLLGADAGVLAVVGSAVAGLGVLLAEAVLLGLSGRSPGKAALGLRVVDVATAAPLGVPRALVRGLVLAVATLPTCGLGAATLAWTAVADPSGRRRGWHDQRVRSVVVDVRPAAPVAAEPATAPQPLVNLTALRLSPPEPESEPEPAPVRAAAVPVPDGRWRVELDTGESLLVAGLTLIGRDPEPRAGERADRLVPLPSEDQSLSKTHAQLLVVPDGALVVMDRGSTNGSVLVRAGVSRPLTPHRATTLLPGDLVRLGDRSLTVSRG